MYRSSGATGKGGRELLVGLDTASNLQKLAARLVPIEILQLNLVL
jgi:hypothetical protein